MKLTEIFLLSFFIFLPFQFAFSPVPGIDLASIRIFSLILFFIWLIQSMKIKKIMLPQPQYLFFFLAFFLFSLASFLWSENREWNIRKNMFFLSFAPLFIVFFSSLSQSSLKDKVLKYLLYSTFFLAFLSLIIFCFQFIYGASSLFHFLIQTIAPFFLGQSFGNMVANYPSLLVNISGYTIVRAVGIFPDPHMLSLFLGMMLPFAILFFFKENASKRKKWLIIILILLIADFFTFSRGGYVGMLGSFVVFCFLFFIQYRISKIHLLRFSVGTLIFFSLLFSSPIGTRFVSSFSHTDASNRERIRLWKEAGSFILSHPLLGSGLGNYALKVKPSAEYREPIYIHNLYLDIAGELGITGLVLFLGFIFSVSVSVFKKWYYNKDMYALAVCSSLSIFLFHSFFETALFSVHIFPLLLFLLVLGIL